MVAPRRLPQGRGIRRGEESFIEQGESFSTRRAELPLPVQPWVCAATPYSFTGVATYTANRLHLFALPVCPFDTIVDQARINVTVNAAGSDARAAIYALDFSTNRFSIVPGSEISLSGATITVVSNNLARPIRIVAGKSYFLGVKLSSAGLELASIASAASAGLLNALYVASGAGSMVPQISLAALTKTTTSPIPGVIYLNRLWRDYV